MLVQTTDAITSEAKPGDVNGDGTVNVFDLVISARQLDGRAGVSAVTKRRPVSGEFVAGPHDSEGYFVPRPKRSSPLTFGTNRIIMHIL